MKHYLITGGAGFIGSNLTRALFEQEPGCRITCLDNFDPFYPADIKQFNIRDFKNNPDYRFVYQDISTAAPDELAGMIEGPVDVVIHIAAKAGVRPSIENPLAYQQVNVIGLQNILEYARENSIRHMVFASSSSVYGINDHYPWKEDEQLMPISPYAMTKLAGEMLGHVYHKLYGIRFTALRFFTVYGPGQRPDLAIHKFMKAILNGEPVTMYGDGQSSRDYTYVEDTVSGIMAAIHYNQGGFDIINLGNNYTVTLKELVAALEEVTGKQAVIRQLPEQPGDVPRTFADIGRAKELLGYNPKTPLKEGLQHFYDWYMANRELLNS